MFKEKDFESYDSLVKRIDSLKIEPFREGCFMIYDNKNNYLIYHLISFLLKSKNLDNQKVFCEVLKKGVLKPNFRYTAIIGKLIQKTIAEEIFSLDTAIQICCLLGKDEVSKKSLIKFVKDDDKWNYFNFYLGTLNPQEKAFNLVEFLGFFKSKSLVKLLKEVKLSPSTTQNKAFINILKRKLFYASNRGGKSLSAEDTIDFFIPFFNWLDDHNIDLFKSEFQSLKTSDQENAHTFIKIINEIPIIGFVRYIFRIIDDEQKKAFYNFFRKKLNKNFSKENERVFNKFFFLELSKSKIQSLKTIYMDDMVLTGFLVQNNKESEHKGYDNLIKLFNKKSLGFSRIRVLTSITNALKHINLEFFKRFYKEIDHNLIKDEGSVEERIGILVSFLSIIISKKDNKLFRETINLFFEKNKDIHFVEFISEIHFKALADEKIVNKINQKIKIIYDAWKMNTNKFSIITNENYNPEKFLPMAQGSLMKSLVNVSSKEDFITMFSKKKEIQKNMESFLKEFDVYKFWIVGSLFRCKFNYDLINTFIKSEVQLPVYDFISTDISEIIEEIKPYYTEKRIVSLLSKRINLEFLEEPDNVISFLKEKGVFKASLPKKPKGINDIFTSLKLKVAQFREEDEKIDQGIISSLNKKKFGYENEFEIIVPKTHFELVKAGIELGQCVGGGYYTKAINSKKISIIFIYKNSEIKYCIELDDNLIIRECGGYKNSKVPVSTIKDLKILINLFKNKLKNKVRN